ncbi:hypothetical protein F1193_07660 [Blastochloris sulfoviridis]|uniref:SPOR domain-containing protein n=2 Tax=Blastochloris sulfoviridis TaxID=50712 RepID=A0A5M6I1F6_9HYPH|nr:hypothetical protein F1193_07660 [Blastochloris sulfoviridis]
MHMAESRYRYPAEGHDDAQRAGSGTGRPDRVEDPLAELARLIGQEDPFKDFDKTEPAPPPVAEEPSRAAAAAAQAFERLSRPSQVLGKTEAARPDYSRPDYAKPDSGRSEYERYDYGAGSQAYGAGAKAAGQGAGAYATQERSAPAAPDMSAAPAYTPSTPAYSAPVAPAPRQAAAEASYYREDPYRRHEDVAEYDRDYGAEEPAYDPYYSEDGNMPPHGEGLGELPQRSRSRLIIMLVGSVIGLAAVGTGAVFGYRALVGGGEPPTIKAEAGPNKVAPSGTQDSINQKLIYDRVGGAASSGNENLVSREEQPVELGRPGQPRVVLPGGVDPAVNEPRKVRTMTVRADGTLVPSAPGPVATATPARPITTPVAPAAPVQVAPVQPMAVQPQPPTPRPVTPAPVQPQRTAAIPANGGFVVQVSAARSQAEAQAALRSVQSKYSDVLAGQPTSVRKVNLGDRGTFYRAHIGPFATRDQANDLCSNLRSAGGDCIVQQRN